MAEPAISAIVPVLDEAGHLPSTLHALQETGALAEILVVDGGSRDGTPELASGFEGVRVIRAREGRGHQMNAGAREARGDVLWFVHADTRMPPGAVAEIHKAMQDVRCAGGAFRFSVDSPRRRYRGLEIAVAARCRFLGLAYGDQALFVRTEAFWRLGSYPDWPCMEELPLVGGLRRQGRFARLDLPARSSPRRWERNGFFRTSLRNLALAGSYAVGWRPRDLSTWGVGDTVAPAPCGDRAESARLFLPGS
jgi:rSAM/selenodomain-associated transferase 2